MARTRRAARVVTLMTAEAFWYILGCLSFGANYFAKVPIKKALEEYGLVEMTAAKRFWYVVMNISFGSGYLVKVVSKKAFSESELAA